MDVWISGFGQALRNGLTGFGGRTIAPLAAPPQGTGDVSGVWNMAADRKTVVDKYHTTARRDAVARLLKVHTLRRIISFFFKNIYVYTIVFDFYRRVSI